MGGPEKAAFAWGKPVSLHPRLYWLAFVLAGALFFVFVLLCTIGLLAESRCGATFGYYGCDVPTANIQKENNQLSSPQQFSRGTTRVRSRL
jgi:hypothetical protein